MANVGNKVKTALAALKGFIGVVKISMGDIELGIDTDPLVGVGDSGDLEIDLPDLLAAVAEAADEKGSAVALLIDEIQYFSLKELSSLIMAMHRMQQKSLPLVLVGAGLPILPGLAGESKSYAERLFSFPKIGALAKQDAMKALQEPVLREGIEFSESALLSIFKKTQGYPYFIQEWGYQAWNCAKKSPIDELVISEVSRLVGKRLDENFFKVRFDRLTPREKIFLRAMAESGKGHSKTSNVADLLNVKVTSLGPLRANLIRKGMIYSPAFGEMTFTVPLFDEFIKRAIPDLPAARLSDSV